MERPNPTPFATVCASTFTFAAFGLGEWVWLSGAGHLTGASVGDAMRLFVDSLGLCGLLGAVVGIALAVVVPPFVRLTHPIRWLSAQLGWRGVEPASAESRNRSAAWLLAGLGALVPLMVCAAAAGYLAHGFMQRPLAAAFVGLASVGALGAAAACGEAR